MNERVLDGGRDFIRRQGRVLERRLFASLFEGAPSSGVRMALDAYANPDGGFGHGLEPDKRCPDSQPLDVEIALATLDIIEAFDGDVAHRACDYLESIDEDGGVPLGTPAILPYPHAEHWGEWAFAPALNPTAGLVALCHKHGVDHHWVARARAYCERALQNDDALVDAHTLLEVLAYAEHCDRGALDVVRRALAPARHFRSDPDDPEYGVTPLHFAPSPSSFGRALFDDGEISGHLDALRGAQQDDGGWPLSWEPPSEAAVLEYRGVETLRAVRTLSAYAKS